MTTKCEHCGSFNHYTRQCHYPQYPAIPAAKKFRAIPRNELTTEQSIAYSAAIVSTVRRLQDAWWRSERAIDPPHCASGTWHNDADAISAAIRAKQKANLRKPQSLGIGPDGVGVGNRERTDVELIIAYEAAMQAKRAAAQERAASSCAEGARAA